MKRWVSSLWLLVLGTLAAAFGAVQLAAEMTSPDSVVPALLVLAPAAALVGFCMGKAQRAVSKISEPASAEIIPFAPRLR